MDCFRIAGRAKQQTVIVWCLPLKFFVPTAAVFRRIRGFRFRLMITTAIERVLL